MDLWPEVLKSRLTNKNKEGTMSGSALANHKLYYEDVPDKTRKGGKDKDSKMSKSTNTPEAKAPVKKYQKSRGEHFKDILIAILVTSIFAFVAGMVFANKQQAEVRQAVKAAQVVAPVASNQGK